MKKVTLLTIATLLSFWAQAQIIIESVSFDSYVSSSNNDLTNNFKFGTYAATGFITQTQTNGITGGALVPPSNVSWGNDVLQYCSTYKNSKDSLIETSLSFYYNTSLINPNANERSIAIWLRGTASNHDVGFYLNKNLTLSITTYNYAQNTQISLTNGHWYKLVAQYKSIGASFNDQVFAKAEIFDLGSTGSSSPSSVGNHTATIYDANLVSSSEFIVELTGTKWGGSEYLDNFVFNGEKNRTICNVSGITDLNKSTIDILAYPIPTSGELKIQLPSNLTDKQFTITFYDVNSSKIKSQSYSDKSEVSISIADLPSGIYYYTMLSDAFTSKPQKIILIK